LPVTERLAAEVLTLPCFPEMTDDEVAHVAASCNAWRP
jgi:dTDP-4-amino-4,6-dideoxygalactose transaminase